MLFTVNKVQERVLDQEMLVVSHTAAARNAGLVEHRSGYQHSCSPSSAVTFGKGEVPPFGEQFGHGVRNLYCGTVSPVKVLGARKQAVEQKWFHLP